VAVGTSSFAAPAGSAPSPGFDADYRPGVCNIGPAEIARRRRTGVIGTIATVVLLAILVAVHAPTPLRLLLFVPAAVAASGFLQAWLRFCAGFGWLGVFNFGELGGTQTVADAAARLPDRLMAGKIGLAAAAVGLIVAIVAVLLPL
jgi:hypothetical protein